MGHPLGADAIMDLAPPANFIHPEPASGSPLSVPIGTVPIYQVAGEGQGVRPADLESTATP